MMKHLPLIAFTASVLVYTPRSEAQVPVAVQVKQHFVVHHDPSTVRLSSDLIQSVVWDIQLLDQDAVEKPPKGERPGLFLVTSDQEKQPAGVYSGTLTFVVSSPGATDLAASRKTAKSYAKELLKKLEESLQGRLYRARRDEFDLHENELRRTVAISEAKLRSVRKKMRRFAPAELAAAQSEFDRLVATRSSVRLELGTNEPLLELLQKQLAKAGDRLALTVDKSHAIADLLRRLQLTLTVKTGNELAELGGKIHSATRESDVLTRQVQQHAQTVERLSALHDETTVLVNRATFRLKAMDKQIDRQEEELQSLRRRELDSRELADKARAAERDLEAAQIELQIVRKQIRALRRVRVVQW